MPGRPRKPTAVKQAQGTDRPDRAKPNEPQYAVTAPGKPGVVSDKPVASAEWDRIVPLLLEQRAISTVSLSSLTAYCLAYDRVVAVEGDPESTIKERIDCATSLRQSDSALGITPTTVAKVSAAPASEKKSNLAAIQARRGLRAVG